MTPPQTPDDSVSRTPAWRIAVRMALLAVAIVLVLWFGQKGAFFVYQGF